MNLFAFILFFQVMKSVQDFFAARAAYFAPVVIFLIIILIGIKQFYFIVSPGERGFVVRL